MITHVTIKYLHKHRNFLVQVSLVICGRYVPSFWTVNLEFTDKKCIFYWKIVILNNFARAIK